MHNDPNQSSENVKTIVLPEKVGGRIIVVRFKPTSNKKTQEVHKQLNQIVVDAISRHIRSGESS